MEAIKDEQKTCNEWKDCPDSAIVLARGKCMTLIDWGKCPKYEYAGNGIYRKNPLNFLEE